MNGNLTFVQAFGDLGQIIARRWWALLLLAVGLVAASWLSQIVGAVVAPPSEVGTLAGPMRPWDFGWSMFAFGLTQATLVVIARSAMGYPVFRGTSPVLRFLKGLAWATLAALVAAGPGLAVLAWEPPGRDPITVIVPGAALLLVGFLLLPILATAAAGASLGGSLRVVYRYGWRALRYNAFHLMVTFLILGGGATVAGLFVGNLIAQGLFDALGPDLADGLEDLLATLIFMPAWMLPVFAAGRLAMADLAASPEGTAGVFD